MAWVSSQMASRINMYNSSSATFRYAFLATQSIQTDPRFQVAPLFISTSYGGSCLRVVAPCKYMLYCRRFGEPLLSSRRQQRSPTSRQCSLHLKGLITQKQDPHFSCVLKHVHNVIYKYTRRCVCWVHIQHGAA